MRLFKYVLLSLNPSFYMDIRAEAKRQNVSVSTLIRMAVHRYLLAVTNDRLLTAPDPRSNPKSLVNQPVATWTSAEQRFADKVLRVHFEEDR
jgi:hypothetical protein